MNLEKKASLQIGMSTNGAGYTATHSQAGGQGRDEIGQLSIWAGAAIQTLKRPTDGPTNR